MVSVVTLPLMLAIPALSGQDPQADRGSQFCIFRADEGFEYTVIIHNGCT